MRAGNLPDYFFMSPKKRAEKSNKNLTEQAVY